MSRKEVLEEVLREIQDRKWRFDIEARHSPYKVGIMRTYRDLEDWLEQEIRRGEIIAAERMPR